ncbi:MAG: amino acid adenylation domain-containing protein [Saccharofermentans sp.]|nr:amino acid adenylation domain-containing protein [Saccharofermentans sp.]
MAHLTPAQKSISDLAEFYKDSGIDTLCGAVLFDEKLDKDLVTKAVRHLLSKHENFNLRFTREDGRIVQNVVVSEDIQVPHKSFDSIEELREYCNKDARIPFGCDGSVMYRIMTFDLPSRSGIMLSASHLIADAWTYSLIVKYFYDSYNALKNGLPLDMSAGRYSDYILKSDEYLASDSYLKDKEFWEAEYSGGISPSSLGRTINESGIESARYITGISEELSQAAVRFAVENKSTIAVLFETAILIYLDRINGEEGPVTIGVPISGRGNAEEKKTAGMIISTIPLTAAVEGSMSVISLCRKVSSKHREIFRHRRLPYEDIIRAARQNSAGLMRLYNVIVSCQNSRTDVPSVTEWFSGGHSEVPLAIHIDDRDSNGNYKITIDHQTGIYSPEEAALTAERIKHIIRQMVSDKDLMVKDISILPPSEKELILDGFNQTAADYRKDSCVQEMFSEKVISNPDGIAISFAGKDHTFANIDMMSDTLASSLIDKGAGPGNIVPIIASRSHLVIISMLAVLKTGAAYMPVSPDYPESRISYMTDAVTTSCVLTSGYDYEGDNVIDLDTFDFDKKSEKVLFRNSPADLCYVVFTSGSTGKPKAVGITHKNVLNYCACNQFNVAGGIIKGSDRKILSVTNIVFDIFVTESILALLNGIQIVMASDDDVFSGKALASLIRSSGANIIQTTPTKMKSYLLDKEFASCLKSIGTVILGGEEFPESLAGIIASKTGASIYNIYGPAETTVWSSYSSVGKGDITIGKPVANTSIYILDGSSAPCPVGITGGIFISGDGVGPGYINNPELSSERFVPDPWHEGQIMYETGDLGYFLPDGRIRFCGRRDGQIKLRGLRIELGEIEHAMTDITGIDLAAAVLRKDDSGNPYLIGFYTSSIPVLEQDIRTILLGKLPSYMVPNRIIPIEKMPLTASGKIERKSLPEVTVITDSANEYVAPGNDTEKVLCELFAKVLKRNRTGCEDDFFESGGDSFAAMELVALASEKGLEFGVRSIYECRSVRKLAASIGSVPAAEEAPSLDHSAFPLERTPRDLRFFRRFASFSRRHYRLNVKFESDVDFNGRFIICPDHETMLDPLWVWAALEDKIDINDCAAIGAAEFLDKKLSSSIFRLIGGIPVDRTGDFLPALTRAEEVILKEKKYLLIHPEGTRSRTGELSEFKIGAGIIAANTGIPVIPVSLHGAGGIFPVGTKRPKLFAPKDHPLTIRFGSPVVPEGKSPEEIMAEVREQIVSLR